jgi:uncharacterized damage-inducible protein DinB
MIAALQTLLTYHRWAEDRFVVACRPLSPDEYATPLDGGWSSIRSIMVHLAGAADIWGRRLRGESPTHRPTEEEFPTLAAVAELFDTTYLRLQEELARRDEVQLAAPWTYHALDGSSRTIPVWTVFHHIVNHGSYHRGQLANRLARRGVTVPATDFVIWAAEENT